MTVVLPAVGRQVRSAALPVKISPQYPFGARVEGLDLTDASFGQIGEQLRAALANYQLLVFPGQSLSPSEQAAFTEVFGPHEPGLARRPDSHKAGHANVLRLSNESGSPTEDYGMGWHSDGLAYARVPHGATILHCIECPRRGGDTLFASQYMAFDAMSKGFQDLLKGLYWHLPPIPYSEVPEGRSLMQPLVRTHPATRREFVFCAPGANRLRGMTQLESAGVLGIVRGFQTREEAIYRHQWAVGDVVVWENCALLHTRADVVDLAAQGARVMHRTATAGDFEAVEGDLT